MTTRHMSPLGALVFALASVLALSQSAAHAEPTPAPDNSLTVKEYLEAGIPPIDKVWDAGDFEKALKALQAIAKVDPTKLPRFNSQKSGAVFAHLVAMKNIASFDDKAVSVDVRIQSAGNTLVQCGQIVGLYGVATKPEQTFDAEVLELEIFSLRAEIAAERLITEFKAAHGMKEDNEGFKTARGGFATTANEILDVVTDRADVRTSEAIRFCEEIKDLLPMVMPALTPEAREQFKAHLRKCADNEANKELKAKFDAILTALK